jgi:hypothetical protein
VRESNLELWHKHHEQLLQEAERIRLVGELRAARRRGSSRPSGRDDRVASWIASKILAALRFSREKARCRAIRSIGRTVRG